MPNLLYPVAFFSSLILHIFPASTLASEVRVYSGRHYNTDRAVYKQFSEQTGIRVRLMETSGISLIERIKREGANTKADVIILVDAARINNAANAGLFQPIASSRLDRDVPARYRDPGRQWYGLTRRVRVIIANPGVVNLSRIKSYSDLSDLSLKDKLCLRNRKNVYNQSLVADQLVLRGEAATKTWLKGMTSNVSQTYFPGDVALVRAVAQGKCGVSIVNHYYVARMRAGVSGQRDQMLADKVRVITPSPAHVNISAAAISKYAQNRSGAIKLIEFLASLRGSSSMANPTYEYPLKGFGQSPQLKNLGTFTPGSVTISQLGSNNAKAVELMTRAGWK
ncbi:iron ABC transporter substrate-binding protein [cyanobiont of Ornithocercus magnificus]|nr:iron ABC transporter substrate-binding protein [cyanobiont of Ornithocercus magnificus]